MLNVLYIADPGSVGGATRALVEVVTEIRKLGVNPIVCTSVYNELNYELTNLCVQNFPCGHESAMNTKSPYRWKRPLKYPYECFKYYVSLPRAISTIEKTIDLSKIDIIHTNSARNDIGCILNKKYGIPHVMHIREFGKEDFNCCIYRPFYYQYISKYSNVLLGISNAVAQSWIKKGVNRDKLRVLYDGVDINSVEYDMNHNFDKKSMHMVISGGICEPKGQHIVIEALGFLPERIKKNLRLDIIGWSDPRYEIKIKKRAEQLGVMDMISFLGVRKDLYQLLKNYDIGLTCSKSEGFGRVTAEYLYAGLGVIGANTGATPELIREGRTGLLFNYPDPQSLANCICELFDNREELKLFAHNAHEDAVRFSAKRNAKEIFEVYLQCNDSYINKND